MNYNNRPKSQDLGSSLIVSKVNNCYVQDYRNSLGIRSSEKIHNKINVQNSEKVINNLSFLNSVRIDKLFTKFRAGAQKYVLKNIPPIITSYGCKFKSKSQENRFFKIYKYLEKIRRNISINPNCKGDLLFSFIQAFVPLKFQIDITRTDIREMANDLIQMNNPSQIFKNRIIKLCIVTFRLRRC